MYQGVRCIVELIVRLQRDFSPDSVSRIDEMLRDAGTVLRPLHPGSDDPELRRYFTARDVPDAQLSRLLARLRAADIVDAAYTKPSEELP